MEDFDSLDMRCLTHYKMQPENRNIQKKADSLAEYGKAIRLFPFVQSNPFHGILQSWRVIQVWELFLYKIISSIT